MRTLLLAFPILLLGRAAGAETWYVNPDGSGDALTVQAGLDLASAGDVVEVACGTYPESLVMKSGVTLRGQLPGCVILDGESSFRILTASGAAAGTRLENLAFVNGLDANSQYGWGWGGAVLCEESTLELVSCSFVGNRAGSDDPVDEAPGRGGAVFAWDSDLAFRDCVFEDNEARSTSNEAFGEGGALCLNSSRVDLIGCRLEENRALGQGGAVFGYGPGALSAVACTLSSNRATAQDADGLFGLGGAIRHTDDAELVDCRFEGNVATVGGAVLASGARIAGCTFLGNTALDRGGALRGGDTVRSSLFLSNSAEAGRGGGCVGVGTIEECRFEGNTAWEQGGAGDGGTWIDCLVVGNSVLAEDGHGGGMRTVDPVVGCTVVGNTAPQGAGVSRAREIERSLIAFNHGGQGIWSPYAEVTCSDVIGNEGGDWVGEIADQLGTNGNLEAFPLFCDPGHEYTLSGPSPCLPANNPCGVLIGAFGEGCGAVAIERTTWGRIKAGFR